MTSWENLLNGLKDDLATEVKGEITNFLSRAKSDSSDFIREQASKVENYLNQLANGEITKVQLEGYCRDHTRLLDMQKLKLQVAEKAGVQRLIDGITGQILDRLLKLL